MTTTRKQQSGAPPDKVASCFERANDEYVRHIINGIAVKTPPPVQIPKNHRFVGRWDEILELQCALNADLTPVIISSAGQGKTSCAFELARMTGKPLYLVNGHEDLTAEQLLIDYNPTVEGNFDYVMQPLLAGVISGGIVVIDEINRLNDSTLASLFPLLDGRRMVSSTSLGMTFRAAEGFSMFGLANPFTSPLPPAADQRLRPVLKWEDYSPAEVIEIVKCQESLANTALDRAFKKALAAHPNIPVRSALNILRFARTIQQCKPEQPVEGIVARAIEANYTATHTEEQKW